MRSRFPQETLQAIMLFKQSNAKWCRARPREDVQSSGIMQGGRAGQTLRPDVVPIRDATACCQHAEPSTTAELSILSAVFAAKIPKRAVLFMCTGVTQTHDNTGETKLCFVVQHTVAAAPVDNS